MSEPPDLLTPAQVARFLMGLTRRLDELVDEYKKAGRKMAETKHAAARAEAKAYLETAGPGPDGKKPTVGDREAMVTLAVGDELFAADLAKAELDGCREAIRALHARLDVGRTLSATSRAEMQNFGGQT